MRKVFNSNFQITQKFGINKDYYKQFGLQGHEGIDLIPSNNDWRIYALEDGVVVLDDDEVGSIATDPYGKIVTLWHPKINKATMYAHLTENYVSQGQLVKRGDLIGKMGSTGNSTGPHLHLNLFETDKDGYRLNRKNGFLGGIDPLPFLQEPDIIVDEMPPYLKSLFQERNINPETEESKVREFFGKAIRFDATENDLNNARKELDETRETLNNYTTANQQQAIIIDDLRKQNKSLTDTVDKLQKALDSATSIGIDTTKPLARWGLDLLKALFPLNS